ncbi:DUF2268 domain-containing protein [Gracilibacillus phocaeensis]|uniref:DUF2268 domain-containing protein n=1 Tax=Gracilibacillus phocaeensis TaxID=2042304 RepID=UPI00102F7D6B|nr:DUF2268 domain-containing putative Zn-dependent protease [Gracilibacillus phocaeensis]
MLIHPTDKWLREWLDQRQTSNQVSSSSKNTIGNKLSPYFSSFSASSIQSHLLQHGMFDPDTEEKQIEEWLSQPFHRKAGKALKKCQEMWNGPDTNVFILPSNENISEFKRWYNSNAGLSFPDKLLLFLQKRATNTEILALVIHEYSHICRLHHFSKPENEYTVLDAIMLEGTAEWLVRKHVGEKAGNKRINWLSDTELQQLWERWVTPYISITRDHPRHDTIMYGAPGTPKNIGYLIGFNIVARFMKQKKLSGQALLKMKKEDILSAAQLK